MEKFQQEKIDIIYSNFTMERANADLMISDYIDAHNYVKNPMWRLPTNWAQMHIVWAVQPKISPIPAIKGQRQG